MPARANHGGGNQPSSASQQPQAADHPTAGPESAPVEEPEQKVSMTPPKPQPPRVPHPDTYLLTDIPCVFLHERGCWSEFKKSLNECALTWGLPDWMTTIVYKGVEWRDCATKGTDLSIYFPVIQKTGAGDGLISKQSVLGAKLTALLERPKNLGSFKPSQIFCCLATVEYEEDRKLPARQKLWTWITKSLRGNRPAAAPYHYLVDEVDMYDISHLFKRLVDVLEQITICSLDDELEEIIKMDYKPSKQNIFSYLGDLKRAIKKLNDINERLPPGGRIVLPDSYVRSRLIRAARQVPVYKPVLDRLLITPMNEWTVITSDDLLSARSCVRK